MKEFIANNTLETQVQGIAWPPLAGARSITKLSMLFQLEQSQWWSRETIEQQQFIQLRSLLHHCRQHVPYYKQLLQNINIPELGYQQWQSIPVLTRNKLQAEPLAFNSQVIPASHGKLVKQRTSGSTGKAIETTSSEIDLFFWDVFTLRDHVWHKRDLTKKLAVIRFTENKNAIYPGFVHSDNWGRATRNVYQTGECDVLSIFTPLHDQVTWLQQRQPYYLLSHPSIIKSLAQHCLDNNINFPFLGQVRTISEALPDDLRDLCQRAWGVELVDVYSTVELGYLAIQCPERDHYHLQSENAFIEILDDNNQPCKPGETGRVIVTNLHNFSMPLIRYEVGDYAEVGKSCSCGRGLPVITKILGRYRNMLTLPDGTRRYPQLGIQDLYKIAPVIQFQAVQSEPTTIDINIVIESALTEDQSSQIQDKYQSLFGNDFLIKVNQVEKIGRSKSGKFEEFISLI